MPTRPKVDEFQQARTQQYHFKGNRAHLNRLLEALDARDPSLWNAWRKAHPSVRPNLRGVWLQQENVSSLDLTRSNLCDADLTSLHGWWCRMSEADLTRASLSYASLKNADLRGARLERAMLVNADLSNARLQHAKLRGAFLVGAHLNGAELQGADLRRALITGASAWDVKTDAATRQNPLLVGLEWFDELEWAVGDAELPPHYRRLEVKDLESANLLFMIANNPKVSLIVNAATNRIVLILGRFSRARKAVLRKVKERLLQLAYVPVIFDFDVPENRDVIESVLGLAYLSHFVIADLTDPRSIPLEAYAIVPQIATPFASIIAGAEDPFSMFGALRKYPWVMPTVHYGSAEALVRHLERDVIFPAEQLRKRLARWKPASRSKVSGSKKGSRGRRGRKRTP
jgi:uncharacterized protein YjbI with pentapeptide repeats